MNVRVLILYEIGETEHPKCYAILNGKGVKA